MKTNKIPHKANKGFKVPPNYFEELDAEIFTKLEVEMTTKISKNSGFSTPADYFKDVENRILDATKSQHKGKLVSLFSLKNAAMLSGVAAALLLFITLVISKGNSLGFEDIETTSIESYLSEKEINTYEMAQILELNNIDLYEVTNADISESTLEDYLLENATLEDLYQD